MEGFSFWVVLESSNQRIQYFSLVTLVSLLGLGAWQVRFFFFFSNTLSRSQNTESDRCSPIDPASSFVLQAKVSYRLMPLFFSSSSLGLVFPFLLACHMEKRERLSNKNDKPHREITLTSQHLYRPAYYPAQLLIQQVLQHRSIPSIHPSLAVDKIKPFRSTAR